MHTVLPEIRIISSNTDIELERVNKVTIINQSEAKLDVGFQNSYITLDINEQTAFESGSNAWFDRRAVLQLRFLGGESVPRKASVVICRVDKPSNIFADALTSR